MRKITLYLAITLASLFLLSGCALLLSQFLAGTNQRQYTAYVYFNGLPKEILDKTETVTMKDVIVIDTLSVVKFSITEPQYILQEYNISYIVNGLNKATAFTFTSPESNKVNIEASLSMRYATDTTFVPYSLDISIEKAEYTLPNNSKNFYVLIDMTDETNKNIKLLDFSNGYKFIIRTSNEEFVRIFDGEKYRYLFTKNISENNECVFIGERGKTYTFESLATTRIPLTRTAPLDPSISSEVVELK
uniref:Lipoprotein n=1 Tax=Fervidobacterium nodosum TaxID=2424 RepID=A0A7C5Y5R9_9BACT